VNRDLQEFFHTLGFDAVPSLTPASAVNAETLASAPLAAGPAPEAAFSTFEALRDCALGCTKCKLAETRTQVVFGDGSTSAKLMFVGEGPGADEDRQGLPFVGKAGELLNRMITAMGLSRSEVYIANVVKCRPPGNRNPEPDEVASCTPYLKQQIDFIRPQIIVALGTFAAQTLLQTTQSISKIRGDFVPLKLIEGMEVQVMPTFHPAFLLRNAEMKKPVWEDLQKVMKQLGLNA
jgi:DNA polymerase